MYIDNELLLSDEQDIGAGGGTQVSTNVVDLDVARRLLGGAGNQRLYAVVVVDESFATSTSIEIQVVTDDNASLSSPTVQVSTGAIAIADLTAGRKPIVIPLANPIDTEERYLGLNYVEVGSASTAGKVTAFITPDPQMNP